MGWGEWIVVVVSAYFLADLLNGIIHMIMDHNENYTSIYGPLVAQFHLHHQTPLYTPKALPLIYFIESGAKIWLAPYLFATLLLVQYSVIPNFVLLLLVLVGVLSSVAEVSHYLCHTSKSKSARFLASLGLLLSRKHHMPHHAQDNINYAFLNGMSDPLINRLAVWFYPGYKQTTDLHFARYSHGNEGHRL